MRVFGTYSCTFFVDIFHDNDNLLRFKTHERQWVCQCSNLFLLKGDRVRWQKLKKVWNR